MASKSGSRTACLVGFAIAACGLAAGAIALGQCTERAWRCELSNQPIAAESALWAAVFVAAVISSTVGFAFSAIAGAILIHVVPDPVRAVQIMMAASIGSQLYGIAAMPGTIDWGRCARFVAPGIAALPLGMLVLFALRSEAYVLVMGWTLIAYGSYAGLRAPAPVFTGERPLSDAAIGALGGISGPFAALPGAPVVIWCGLRGWDKTAQRALYQPYILIMQVAALIGIGIVQPASFDAEVVVYAIPGLAGAVLGVRMCHALSERGFQRLVNTALIASGAALVLE